MIAWFDRRWTIMVELPGETALLDTFRQFWEDHVFLDVAFHQTSSQRIWAYRVVLS
jgi:hypothetical protein